MEISIIQEYKKRILILPAPVKSMCLKLKQLFLGIGNKENVNLKTKKDTLVLSSLFHCVQAPGMAMEFFEVLEKNKSYVCDICHKAFTEKAKLKRHQSIHLDVRKMYPCDVCSKSFTWKDNLERHKRRFHRKHFQLKLLTLDERESVSNPGLGWKNLRITCEICLKTFSCKSSLRVHRHYQHIRKRSFSCHLCGKILSRKQSLDRHIRSFHLGTDKLTDNSVEYQH
ncbi:zinc finger and BTB domain-containing protein 41-like [Tachypleus tridentatus]|uniref:zinc finger and BTB domain-containing protein 41-like n=1 Tax=Tachypleus tridentatus TaxID=6853 RepID=UPI003FD12DBC